MNLLQSLFDTAGRRKRQAEELREKIAALEVEHSSAVVGADDGAADKIFAKLEKHRADLRAVEAAIQAAEQHTASARESAAAEAREAQHADALFKIHRAEDLALVFDAVVNGMDSLTDQGLVAEARAAGSVADAWRVYEAAADAAVAAAAVARIPHTTIALRPTKVWNLVWWHFTSAVQRDGREPRLLPQGGSKSREMDTLADRIARERRNESVEA